MGAEWLTSMTRAADHNHIDVHQVYELGYWSRKFGVSREKLQDAIQNVGTNVDEVAHELGKSWEKENHRR